jgi:hypothetical protein
MKYFFTFVFLLALCTGCKQKVLSGAELEKKLVKTMQDFLDKESHPGVAFTVKDVSYFPDKNKKRYDCAFHVNMHTDRTDTIGTMTANISNDFKKVERIQ